MKKITLLLCSVLFVQVLQAQSPLLDSAKHELYQINKAFDSSLYIAFNLDIGLKADSAGITIETDQVSGNYLLNKKHMYYNMGGTEYVQTDSFSYTIYADEKIMVMTKNFVEKASDVFPLRTFVDSVIQYYGNNYTITIDTSSNDSVAYSKRIAFTYNYFGTPDSIPPAYTFVAIEYNDETFFPSAFIFSYGEIAERDSAVFTTLLKTVTMKFSDYKAFSNTEVFNDNQYILYNRQHKIYEPVDKYKDYRFMTAGFENEDEDAQYYREVPYGGN